MARSKSSGRWLKEHFDDEYVKLARQQGYRSRAVFKLREIDQRDGIMGRGMTVVDLGAAPGGWSQYSAKKVGKGGRVIALDILAMPPIPHVEFVMGDFQDVNVLKRLDDRLGESRVDVVLSDMAPNTSGVGAVDQPRSINLAELARDTAEQVLVRGGVFVVKLFQGEGFDTFCNETKKVFAKVTLRKPKASRPRSREVYLVAKGFKSAGSDPISSNLT